MQVTTPWTEEQVKSLNEFQHCGYWHPYICANCSSILVAIESGWICPTTNCDYVQTWAHLFSTNWSWK